MELIFLFKALLRRKWIILISCIIALVTAYLLTKNYKNEYKSNAQLATGFTVSQELKLSNENFNIPQIEVKFNNVIENITSPQVLNMVSYHLILHDLEFPDTPFTNKKIDLSPEARQEAIGMLSAHLDSMKLLSSEKPDEKKILGLLNARDYGFTALSTGLVVARFQKTDYIDINYTSPNPVLSAFVVNTVCDEFKRFYLHNEQIRTDRSVAALDSLTNEKKTILEAKQKAKETFMLGNGLLDVNMEGSNKLTQISNLENQLIEEKGIAKEASYRVEQLTTLINTARNSGLTSIEAPQNLSNTNSTQTPADNSGYIRMRKQYNDLYAEYVQKGSRDTTMRRRLDNLSQNMAKANLLETQQAQQSSGDPNVVSVNDLVQKRIDAQAALESANQKIGSIEAKLSQLQGGLTGIAAKGMDMEKYDKDIQIASADYTSTKDQLNMAINSAQNRYNFKQSLIGVPASAPEKSKKAMIIAVSGVGALFLSCLIIILFEFFDNTIKSPSQFHKLVDLPLIGIVNRIKLQPRESVLEKVAALDAGESHRDNMFLELLRKLRYELETSNKKVILFTSTVPQQGKTMLIQSLSYILSLGKKNVLIIDTNFCNNDLTKAINAEPVLEKFDPGDQPFNKTDFLKLVSPTSVARVGIIGCQGGDYTPSEILPKNHLLNYLDRVKEEYDFIFMEGAPMNDFTDTMELINYADGLIAVFSADANFTNLDKESIQFLEQNKKKFIGAILNKVDEDNLEI